MSEEDIYTVTNWGTEKLERYDVLEYIVSALNFELMNQEGE